jgi:hypothetical protein
MVLEIKSQSIGILIILLIAFCICTGCTAQLTSINTQPTSLTEESPTDFGNGILYFTNPDPNTATTNENPLIIGKTISDYIYAHPNLKIKSVFPYVNTDSSYNTINGYYVIVDNKTVC